MRDQCQYESQSRKRAIAGLGTVNEDIGNWYFIKQLGFESRKMGVRENIFFSQIFLHMYLR